MLEQGLIKTHFLGKDGFIWWIGQVVDQTKWAGNLPETPTDTTDGQKGFDFRYKVRIMGYHTASPKDLSDDDLPWASVMLPVTAGTSGGAVQTPQLRQGNFVYGFFLDGEDAQQPIIMGVIGYNQYTAILKDVPEDGGFAPFSGYTVDDTVPRNALGTTQEEGKAVADEVDVTNTFFSGKTNNKEVMESLVSLIGRKDGASKEAADNESRPKIIPTISKCEPAPLVGIQREMKNMMAEIERIKKTANDWETKVSTKVDNIEEEIAKVKDNATKAIAGDVKRITAEIQKNALKKVNDAFSESYHEVFPTELPELKVKVEEANDELACLFKNIMKNLTGMVGGFLDQIMDRFITTPPCATENFVGSLLGKVSGLIDSAISSVMAPIKSLLAGMGAATSAIDDVMGFAVDALSFLSCEEDPRCSEVKEWNPIGGAEAPVTLDLFSIVNKAKEAAGLVQNAVEGVTNIGDTLSNIAKNADFSDALKPSCNTGPVNCGPPTVEFIGGGGSGATGNVIVSALTTVLGVDIITPGGGYIGAPRLKFTDSCNKGKGARGRAVVGSVPVTDTFTANVVSGTNQLTNVSRNIPIGTPIKLTNGGSVTLDNGGVITGGSVTLDNGGVITGGTGNTLIINNTFGGTGSTTPATFSAQTGKTTMGITQIIIDDTGIDYLQAEDGSQGGDGRTWANADETTVKRSDGTYDMPYKPGKVIDLNEGDEYTTPGKVPIVVTESTTITSPLPPDKPESQKGLFPSTGTGDYPVVLEIEDINIVDPGFGYDANDKVIVGNGAELKIKTDDLGSVTGVDVINGGIGYTEDPDILIKSNTGYNAKLMPIFKVNRVGEDVAPETVSTGSVISVIDCVGKF
tara:strand:- start:617 stop:3190 length:2574 start_codon:yes stop_codon:yes gene_type:complete